MFPRKLISCGHFLPPLLVGLCLGFALDVFFLPFIEENYVPDSQNDHEHAEPVALAKLHEGHGQDSNIRRMRETKDAAESISDVVNKPSVSTNQEKEDNFELRYVTSNPKDYPGAGKFVGKKSRHRYAATELGIREKLFLSFLTSAETVGSLAAALNKTLPEITGMRTAFFMGPKDEEKPLPEGMSLVSFSTVEVTRQNLLFHTIKFLAEHYGNVYDWFAILPETTFVRTDRLFDFVSDLSIASDRFLGEKLRKEDEYCTARGGFVLSNSLLMKAYNAINWCYSHATSDDDAKNLGICIKHVSKVKCQSSVKKRTYRSYNIGARSIDSILGDNKQLDSVHQSLTIYPVSEVKSIYKIHRYISKWELNETQKEIDRMKKEIMELSVYAPGGSESVPWPVGSNQQFKSKKRFHTIRWTYFTESETYFKDEWSVTTPLTGPDKQDITGTIASVKRAMLEDSNGELKYEKMINGYRRFDPTRGMEYIVDVEAKNTRTGETVTKRVQILKPLGEVELIPMPYVTENSKVNLVLPVTLETKTSFTEFMEKFARLFLETGENTYLFIAFFYKTGVPMTGKADPYTLLKSIVTYYENKFHNGAKISWMNIQSNSGSSFDLVDHLSKKFTADSLIFLSTPGSDIDVDFINRVRMNTIRKVQVYFPIAFWQYKPNIVYEKKPYPANVEISEKYGHFDKNIFVHASFYMSDYSMAKAEALKLQKNLSKMDLFDLFLGYQKLHVFRAVEPNLRHHFVEHRCSPLANEEAYHRCLASRASGLASSKQLAMLLMEGQGLSKTGFDYKALKYH